MQLLEEYKSDMKKLKTVLERQIDYRTVNAVLAQAQYILKDYPDERKYCFAYSDFVKKMALREYAQTLKPEWDEMYWQAMLWEAPELFESYLIYLERKREEPERFYLPKREQLNKHGLIQAMQDLEDDKLDLLSISMPPGTQKCQPLYSKVLTPDGFVEMRDIHVGSKVISGNGNIATVLSESSINIRPIYELTFDDGSKCRASDNHLWNVQTRDDRRRNKPFRVVETKDMIKNVYVENGKRANYSIDYVPKIDFLEKKLVIHPYVMGALIGDGGLSNGTPNLSTVDDELINIFNSFLPEGYILKHKERCTYLINGHEGNNCKCGSVITKEIKKYGLFGSKSADKFIPNDYLYASYEQRLWLLRGLMDTDGSAKKSYCSYATISDKLANDVVELVHSLGGYASKNVRRAGYKKNGVYKKCNDYYEIIIQFNSNMESIFALTRKKEIYKPKRNAIKRFITKIEYIGDELCKCIYISDNCHLYITDNYIITHNTTLEKFFCSWIIGRHPKDYSLFFSHSGDITEMFYKGVLDITTNNIEYTWAEIFPKVKLQATNAKAETINFDKYKPYANIQCTSVGSKNAGKVRCNRYLYCDDLIGGIEEALNKNILDKLWRIYSTDARQRKLNEQVKEIHIATRWSVHDVIGRLQRAYEGNDKVRFIAIPDIDPETGESNFNYKYNGMSVAFFHDQELMMDEVSYKCLYKNEPIEREGLLYHDEDFERYYELPDREPDSILGICDTKDRGTDFCFLPIFYQYGDKYYWEDCAYDNGAIEIVDELCASVIIKHNPHSVQFESNSAGGRTADAINEKIKGKCRTRITKKFTTQNKETKIIVNSGWVKEHVLIKDKSMYTPKSPYGKAVAALMSYTVAGKNPTDDVPDGMGMFAEYVAKPKTPSAQVINSPF